MTIGIILQNILTLLLEIECLYAPIGLFLIILTIFVSGER